MPILSALFILGSLALCYAIPCKLIGTGQYDDENGVRQPQLHPFRGGPFDVIKSQDCYIRFQNPDNHPDYQKSKIDFAEAFRDSRVTQASWTQTRESFEQTCGDYTNAFGSNPRLWLTGGYKPYAYAGILLRSEVAPQSNLLDRATVVTYMLPSGVSKVTTVQSNANENCKRLARAGGVGLNGEVDAQTDYAYAPLFRVALGLLPRYPPNRFPNGEPNPTVKLLGEYSEAFSQTEGPFVTAERGDGECVVIDFRSMPDYFANTGEYPWVGVNDNCG